MVSGEWLLGFANQHSVAQAELWAPHQPLQHFSTPAYIASFTLQALSARCIPPKEVFIPTHNHVQSHSHPCPSFRPFPALAPAPSSSPSVHKYQFVPSPTPTETANHSQKNTPPRYIVTKPDQKQRNPVKKETNTKLQSHEAQLNKHDTTVRAEEQADRILLQLVM